MADYTNFALRKKNRKPNVYNLLDHKDTPRKWDGRLTAIVPLTSGDPDVVNRMRIICHMHETMVHVFAQTWIKGRHARLLQLGP